MSETFHANPSAGQSVGNVCSRSKVTLSLLAAEVMDFMSHMPSEFRSNLRVSPSGESTATESFGK
ncbi:MAG TPA: hypothetical protein VJZ76_00470 [Thermoanaerobaculia bacterium]|nr:hypothetical protein [Thermoanaerobaculia bacterium]